MWSPDGRSLSYHLSGTGARDGLYVISREESGRWGKPRQVWSHPSIGHWSPDGRALLTSWTDGIWLVPATGGAARRVYEVPDSINGPEPAYVRWSRDGRAIYLRTVDRRGRASIWSMSPTGGPLRLLVRFDNPDKPSYRWYATDGLRFYFTISDRQSDVYFAELHGWR